MYFLQKDQNFVEQADGSGILEEFAAAIDGRSCMRKKREHREKRYIETNDYYHGGHR